MRVLLASFAALLATAAFAQPDNKPATGTEFRSAQADVQKSDGVPPGGCMPIGLTARGDLVFPMQCRELIERERGARAGAATASPRAAISAGAAEDCASREGRYCDHEPNSGAATQTALPGGATKAAASADVRSDRDRKRETDGDRKHETE
jgi:hypothetical protein